MKKRAGIYARVSTKDQSVEMQLEELRKYVELNGWKHREYVDEGVSGAKASRKALDKLMKDAITGKLDVVLVWKFDRFARSTRQLVTALETFQEHSVDFVSLRETIDTTSAAGKMFFTIVAAFAEFERDTIRERVKAGMQHAKANGTHVGRPRVETDLEAVEELFGKGYSQRKVSKLLGIPRGTLQRALKEKETEECS